MFDFRLRVFDTVARRLNFTKAARELNISQPAVTKHIKELESHFGNALFDRNGNRIALTRSGEVLLNYTDRLFAVYREMEFGMANLNRESKGVLRLGASTTIAQYVLPIVLARFHQKFPLIRVSLTVGNTEAVERLLSSKKIDLGIIEGASKNKRFRYTRFLKDEIALTLRNGHPLAKRNAIKPEELKKIPLLLREPGSGTLETIAFALKPLGLKLDALTTEMQLDSTESIKSYLLHSDCAAFLSVHSVLRELENRSLAIIDVKGLEIGRYFHFIGAQGQAAATADLFMEFALSHNFR